MNRLWRIAGALCLAHVVLLLAGYSQMKSPTFGAGPASIVTTFGGVSTSTMFVGGFIALIAWLVLLAAVTLVGRLLRGTTETAGWLASLGVAAGTLATAVTIGGGFATTGAAFYGAKHGYSTDLVAGITYVSKFADFIAIAALGVCAVGIGGAALASGALSRWFGWLSVATGIVGVIGATGSAPLNFATVVLLGWLVVLAVVLVRGRRNAPSGAADRLLAADAA